MVQKTCVFTLCSTCGAVYCNWSCLWVCGWICYHNNLKLRASTGKGVCGGAKIFGSAFYSQCIMFASPLSTFVIVFIFQLFILSVLCKVIKQNFLRLFLWQIEQMLTYCERDCTALTVTDSFRVEYMTVMSLSKPDIT